MSYYPKSKILEAQFTSGKDFVLKRTNAPYKGYYYTLSNNKTFSGKTYEDSNSEEIIKVSPQPKIVVSGISTNSDFVIPYPYYPTPTEENYKLGFITRYFIKRRNANFTTIIEISPSDYNKYFDGGDLDANLYVATKVNWRISGSGIEDTNRKLIQLKEQLFPGFSFFFKDFKKFSR